MSEQNLNFPFSAVLSQYQFKQALLLAAVSPTIGGVLVSGPRGTAKSTLAKALADILPAIEEGVPPFVTLPLGATEEMLIGTLDLQQVLDDQRVEFQPGLLAKAHKGVLYVDEVNLLPDHLIDQLLDVASSGFNSVERDGISHRHASQFILLGTMNPDEGELRPQLMDRFGLAVVLSNQYSVQERMQVVRLREQFDHDPQAFIAAYQLQQEQLISQITTARELVAQVECSHECRECIAEKCMQAEVDGLRADIIWTKAASAHASLEGRRKVSKQDILAVEELVLHHRRNTRTQNPSSPPQSPAKKPLMSSHAKEKAQQLKNQMQGDWGKMDAEDHTQASQHIEVIRLPTVNKPLSSEMHSSKLLREKSKHKGSHAGQQSSALPSKKTNWFATVLANVYKPHIDRLECYKQKQGEAVIHLILLDTSASVLARKAFAKAKGLMTHIAKAAYLQRQKCVIIGFGNQQVRTLMSLRRAPKAIEQFLDSITAAGGTPLNEAIQQAKLFQQQQLHKDQHIRFKTIIITDGRVRAMTISSLLHGEVVVVDVEQSTVKRGRSQTLAELLNGQYVALVS